MRSTELLSCALVWPKSGDTVREQPGEAGAWTALRAGVAAVLALHDRREQALERFRLLRGTASLRAGWLDLYTLNREEP